MALEIRQQGPKAWSRGDWTFALLLIAAIFAAYQPVWHAGFIWDDDLYVTGNPLLTAPDGLWRIWFSQDALSQYFPLVYTTLRVEHAFWGLAPLGYHCVNIFLHAINALLLWRLLVRLVIPGAWLAAAIFALHPVQVESVAWVTELKNVEMGFFFLLSLLAWTAFNRVGTPRRRRFYFLSLVFYALALFSKTTACTLPAVLLLIPWLRGERITRRTVLEVMPYVAMGLGMGLLTVWWERYHQGAQGRGFTIGLLERLLIAGRGVWFYLDKLFWPAKLTFSYPRWTLSPANPVAWLWLLALCGFGGTAFFARRRIGRGAFAALAFFVVTLCPMLGLLMLYTFRYTFVADHYQYLACIGPIALVSAGAERLHRLSRQRHPFAVPSVCALLLGALGILTWRQSGTYRDIETLWRTTIARNPQSWMAHNNLGMEMDRQGRAREAIAEYIEALQIGPDSPETHYNYANALHRQRRTQEAIAEYREAFRLDPAYAQAHYNLGNALSDEGRTQEAIAEYREACRLHPAYADAHYNLADSLFAEGRRDEAIDQYRETLRLQPANANAHNNLGFALSQQGRADEAIVQYSDAVRLDPTLAKAHYNLGDALFLQGRTDEAIVQYGEALQLDPAIAEAHNNLGLALLRQGRTDEAIVQYEEALKLNPNLASASYDLGEAMLQKGRTADAIAYAKKALALQPASVVIKNTLAWMLAAAPETSLRDGATAVLLATQASQATGGSDPLILHTLAAAYAADGDFSNATKTAQRALQLAQARSNAALVSALPREIKLYQAGQPFHDAP
jgi:tetratricopeptide (TPR) repeat protein